MMELVIALILAILFFAAAVVGSQKVLEKVNLGNYVSVYYHHLLNAILKQEDFHFDTSRFEHDDFIRHLPHDIPKETTTHLYEELINNGVTLERVENYHPSAIWIVNDAIDEKMNTIMKPFMQTLMNDAFVKLNIVTRVDVPVIHFRCADTPFIRSPDYCFQKYSFFKQALDDIQAKLNRKFDSVIILSYVNHKSTSDEALACQSYVELLKQRLEELNYHVDIQSKSTLEDFATIFYAPASISTSSSFSFIAGCFGLGLFLSATNGFRYDGQERCIDCGTTVYKGYHVKHEEVADYLNTDKVLEKLRED